MTVYNIKQSVVIIKVYITVSKKKKKLPLKERLGFNFQSLPLDVCLLYECVSSSLIKAFLAG